MVGKELMHEADDRVDWNRHSVHAVAGMRAGVRLAGEGADRGAGWIGVDDDTRIP